MSSQQQEQPRSAIPVGFVVAVILVGVLGLVWWLTASTPASVAVPGAGRDSGASPGGNRTGVDLDQDVVVALGSDGEPLLPPGLEGGSDQLDLGEDDPLLAPEEGLLPDDDEALLPDEIGTESLIVPDADLASAGPGPRVGVSPASLGVPTDRPLTVPMTASASVASLSR